MSKNVIEILNRWSDKVLYRYEAENATIKEALLAALKDDAIIRDAILRGADLCGADLRDADLRGADLCGADLRGADLCGADLRGAILRGAILRGADLCGADLSGADLRDAILRGADLCGADLSDAILCGADLRDAILRDADLRGADLCGADLRGAKNIPYIPLACPSDGSFTAWKKVRDLLVQLEIPADARRCSATGRKCRCDKAKVVAITNTDGTGSFAEVLNTSQASELLYKVGEMVFPDSFDEDRWNECSHGIHFFINKQDAINY